RVERELSSGLDRQTQRLRALDPFEAHRSVPILIQPREERGLPRLHDQLLKHGTGEEADVDDRSCAITERERGGPETKSLCLVVPGDETMSSEGSEDSMCRGDGQAHGPGDAGGGPLPLLAGEQPEDGKGSIQDL